MHHLACRARNDDTVTGCRALWSHLKKPIGHLSLHEFEPTGLMIVARDGRGPQMTAKCHQQKLRPEQTSDKWTRVHLRSSEQQRCSREALQALAQVPRSECVPWISKLCKLKPRQHFLERVQSPNKALQKAASLHRCCRQPIPDYGHLSRKSCRSWKMRTGSFASSKATRSSALDAWKWRWSFSMRCFKWA